MAVVSGVRGDICSLSSKSANDSKLITDINFSDDIRKALNEYRLAYDSRDQQRISRTYQVLRRKSSDGKFSFRFRIYLQQQLTGPLQVDDYLQNNQIDEAIENLSLFLYKVGFYTTQEQKIYRYIEKKVFELVDQNKFSDATEFAKKLDNPVFFPRRSSLLRKLVGKLIEKGQTNKAYEIILTMKNSDEKGFAYRDLVLYLCSQGETAKAQEIALEIPEEIENRDAVFYLLAKHFCCVLSDLASAEKIKNRITNESKRTDAEILLLEKCTSDPESMDSTQLEDFYSNIRRRISGLLEREEFGRALMYCKKFKDSDPRDQRNEIYDRIEKKIFNLANQNKVSDALNLIDEVFCFSIAQQINLKGKLVKKLIESGEEEDSVVCTFAKHRAFLGYDIVKTPIIIHLIEYFCDIGEIDIACKFAQKLVDKYPQIEKEIFQMIDLRSWEIL